MNQFVSYQKKLDFVEQHSRCFISILKQKSVNHFSLEDAVEMETNSIQKLNVKKLVNAILCKI